MLMCTDPGDLVLDPTCGSGTTAFVAEQWGRRWITIDTSRVALRSPGSGSWERGIPWYLLADSAEGRAKEQSSSRRSAPAARRSTDDIRHGFVYERVQHITLKSIANNPDIKEGMTPRGDRRGDQAARRLRAALRQAVRGHEEGPRRRAVHGRVAEPAPLARLRGGRAPESLGETEAAKDADAPNFEQSILDNLAKAGIQNGRRQERIEFAAFETYAGEYIQAIGAARRRGGRRRAVAGSRSRSARSTAPSARRT